MASVVLESWKSYGEVSIEPCCEFYILIAHSGMPTRINDSGSGRRLAACVDAPSGTTDGMQPLLLACQYEDMTGY